MTRSTDIIAPNSAALEFCRAGIALMCLAGVLGGCGNSSSVVTTHNGATAAISVSASSISFGQSVTITWSSSNAASCTAGGSWSGTIATSGTQQTTPGIPGSAVYSITCGDATASAKLTIYQAPGGSDYAWYQVDMPSCNRESYGVVYNYDTATAIIDSQLQTMYSNGQRRLRIPIYHGRGSFTPGTIMDSTGGTLAPRFLNNLANLLTEIKSVGFEEIEVSFHPEGPNNPTSWTSFSSDYFTENWELIQTLHPIIAGAGIKYHLDLLNEGIPTPSQTVLLEYSQNLWTSYTATFGSSDTVGFSIIPDADRLSEVSEVYGQNPLPPAFDLHFYDNAGMSFASAFTALNGAGFSGKPWILGEAYYNDATEASQLRQQIDATGQPVYFLTQWPLTSAMSCSNVDVAPPVDFSNYLSNHF